MKQETVNTFNEGLNKDLNPIVTPNNLLTDNLNGTFLTYNGDELSLQPDAGNTRIPVKGTGDSVKLSEGFYPLGMKEYGGVLYIVSGKQVEGKADEDLIEIGSYPSPELASYTTFLGNRTITIKNELNLYKQYVINDDLFKTGRYIKFKANISDTNLVNTVRYDNANGLYIIKLYLQLDNGSIDLTEDVWIAFRQHKTNTGDTANHWITSESFIYFCPFNYKGKLIIQVIMDEPIFDMNELPSITTTATGYNFSVAINKANSQSLWISSWNITITPDVTPPITISNISQTFANIPIDIKNNYIQYSIWPNITHRGTILYWDDFPEEFKNKYLFTGTQLLQSKYTSISYMLSEGRCSSSTMKTFSLATLIGEAGIIDTDLEQIGNKKHYVFVEHGSNVKRTDYAVIGEYIIGENNFPVLINTSTIGKSVDPNYTDGRTIENAFNSTNALLFGTILNNFQKMAVSVYDPSCSEARINLEFSIPFNIDETGKITNGSLTVWQSSGGNIKILSGDGKTFVANVDASKDLYISASYGGFYDIIKTIPKEELLENSIHRFGWIVRYLTGELQDISEQGSFSVYTANMGKRIEPLLDELGINSSIGYSNEHIPGTINDTYIIYSAMFMKTNDFNGLTVILGHAPVKNPPRTYIMYIHAICEPYASDGIFSYPTSSSEYINLDSTLEYFKVGNNLGYIIFKKKETFVAQLGINILNIPLWDPQPPIRNPFRDDIIIDRDIRIVN